MNLRPLATIDGATLSLQIDPEAEFGSLIVEDSAGRFTGRLLCGPELTTVRDIIESALARAHHGHPVSLDLTAITSTSGHHDAATRRHRSHRRRLGAPHR